MLFPESSVTEGQPAKFMPVFLFGEKRQAVRTSTLIPPAKRVEKINRDCNRTHFQNFLYVSCYSRNIKLILSRSKYYIDLNRDLDDVAVSLLIENGLGKRFPVPCDAWRSRSAENKETLRKSIFEEKRRVDEQLKNDQPLLEDTLAKEVIRRIIDAYPYAFQVSPVKRDPDFRIVYSIQRSSSPRPKLWMLRTLLRVQCSHYPYF